MKTQIEFNPLDLKVLEELPTLIDSISSVGNKIADIFSPIYEDVFASIEGNLPSGFIIDKKKPHKNIFGAFSSNPYYDNGAKVYKTEFLDNSFVVVSTINFRKGEGKNILRNIDVQFGFYYDSDNEPKPVYFFSLNNYILDKFEGNRGLVHDYEFYEAVLKDQHNYKVKIEHPYKGDTQETIEYLLEENNPTEIQRLSRIFTTEILVTTLKKIKIQNKR